MPADRSKLIVVSIARHVSAGASSRCPRRRRCRLHAIHRFAVAGGAGAGVSRATFDAETRGARARLQTAGSDLAGTARDRRAVAGRVRAGAGGLHQGSQHRPAGRGRAAADGEVSRRARRRSSSVSACPRTVVLAIWGRETDFGRYTLPYDGLRVMATQAYVGRRKDQYRDEFILALKLISDGEVTRKDLRASWAGATGLTQFLPSEFYKHGGRFRRRRPQGHLALGAGCAGLCRASNSSTRGGRRACAGPTR